MKDLIQRLEKAVGPDRELDRDILRFVSGRVVRDETFIYGQKHGTREIETAFPYRWFCWFAPHYTQTIDAALTLVPEGWHWRLDQGRNAGAALYRDGFPQHFSVADTPAIALSIVALKVRNAVIGDERQNG